MSRTTSGRFSRCVVAGVTAAALVACGGGSSAPDRASSPSPRASADDPSYVVARIAVGSRPCAVEGGFGSIWVSVYGDDVELRIDPETHKVLARIETGLAPCGVAIGGGSVWVENYAGDSVTRIDPKTNDATTIEVGSAPYDVTYAAGAAWVTNFSDGTVTRIDARNNRTRTVEVGAQPVGIAPGHGAVWVTSKLDGTLSRIDVRTLDVTTTKVGLQPAWTAWADGVLWISDTQRIDHIDLRTGQVLDRVPVRPQANDGDVVGGTVWVPDNSGDLHGIAAESGKVLGRWPLGLTNPFVVAGYSGSLWVVDFAGSELVELDPAALVSS